MDFQIWTQHKATPYIPAPQEASRHYGGLHRSSNDRSRPTDTLLPIPRLTGGNVLVICLISPGVSLVSGKSRCSGWFVAGRRVLQESIPHDTGSRMNVSSGILRRGQPCTCSYRILRGKYRPGFRNILNNNNYSGFVYLSQLHPTGVCWQAA